MDHKRRLVYSVIQFLNREISSEIPDEAKESLEVASQCLQSAYALNPLDKHLEVESKLEDLFYEATKNEPLRRGATPSPEDKKKADLLKTEGNNLMKSEKYEEAIDKYTKAIELDPSNQVYYCNRAAAKSKVFDHHSAIEDCKRAIDMDPSYGKAYGRLGLAYSCIGKHDQAIVCFKKALELEPDNESYKANLKIAEEKLEESTSAAGSQAQAPDLNNILSNPALLNMATSMMSDPNMQNMMGRLMSGGYENASGMEGLLRAGQEMAEQMQRSNPDLVDQIRRQMQGDPSPESEDKKPSEDR